MESASETKVLVVRAVDVEGVGVREASRVTVSGGQDQGHPGTLRDHRVCDGDVGQGLPVIKELGRGLQAHDFLKHRGR
jgi:hypothetical protein